MTVEASLEAFAPVLARAADLGWWRRGYVSTAFGCPYTGRRGAGDGRWTSPSACSISVSTRSASATRSGSASRSRSPR